LFLSFFKETAVVLFRAFFPRAGRQTFRRISPSDFESGLAVDYKPSLTCFLGCEKGFSLSELQSFLSFSGFGLPCWLLGLVLLEVFLGFFGSVFLGSASEALFSFFRWRAGAQDLVEEMVALFLVVLRIRVKKWTVSKGGAASQRIFLFFANTSEWVLIF